MTSPESLAPDAALTALVQVLERYRYRFSDELQIQAGIAQALEADAILFEREKIPCPTCRFDFWCPEPLLVIEAKVHGSYASALRQVERYVQLPECRGVVIASSRPWANTATSQVLHGKPVVLARLRRQVF